MIKKNNQTDLQTEHLAISLKSKKKRKRPFSQLCSITLLFPGEERKIKSCSLGEAIKMSLMKRSLIKACHT